MDFGLMHSIATVAAVVAFFVIAWWAYSPKNKKRFEEDAKLALDEENIKHEPEDDSKAQPTEGDSRS